MRGWMDGAGQSCSRRVFCGRSVGTLGGLWVSLASVGLLLPAGVQAQAGVAAPASTAAGRPGMAGDLIVRFRDDSDIGQALVAVQAERRTLAEVGELLARSLSADLGLPLQLVRLSTSREALLALDRELLLRQLAERASRDPAVRRADPMALPATVLAAERGSVRLELLASTRPAELPARLALPGLLQPQVQVLPPADAASTVAPAEGVLQLQVDFAALVGALSARLQARPDVAHAQPNRVMRPAGAGVQPPR